MLTTHHSPSSPSALEGDQLHDGLVARIGELLPHQAVIPIKPHVNRIAASGHAKMVTALRLIEKGELFGAEVLKLAGELLAGIRLQDRDRLVVIACIGELPQTTG